MKAIHLFEESDHYGFLMASRDIGETEVHVVSRLYSNLCEPMRIVQTMVARLGVGE